MIPVAAPPPIAIHADINAVWMLSPRQFNAGLGPRIGVRIGDRTTIGASVSVVALAAPMGTLRFDVGHVPVVVGRWRPWFGAAVSASLGRFLLVSTDQPTPIVGPGISGAAVLRPLSFEFGATTLSALELSAGTLPEAPFQSIAVGVGLLEVGYRFGRTP